MAALVAVAAAAVQVRACRFCNGNPPAGLKCKACGRWRCGRCSEQWGLRRASCPKCTHEARQNEISQIAARVARKTGAPYGAVRHDVAWASDTTQLRGAGLYEALRGARFDAASLVEAFLAKRGEMSAVPSRAEVQCGICFTDAAPGEAYRLVNCGHVFCSGCIAAHTEARLSEGAVTIRCLEYGCAAELTHSEVRRTAGEAALDTLLERSLTQAVGADEHIVWCPRPGCGYAAECRDARWECKRCGARECLKCGEPPHHGACVTPEKKLKKALRGLNARKCPGCGNAIEKSAGCNHMTCRCGRSFDFGQMKYRL